MARPHNAILVFRRDKLVKGCRGQVMRITRLLVVLASSWLLERVMTCYSTQHCIPISIVRCYICLHNSLLCCPPCVFGLQLKCLKVCKQLLVCLPATKSQVKEIKRLPRNHTMSVSFITCPATWSRCLLSGPSTSQVCC